MQSYHHDEAWTAGVVLHSNLFTTLDKVSATESTPPLYYLLAWGWTKLFGTGEWGLRSLSALAGVATIPVAFAIGRRLAGNRAAVIAAALVALNPALIWYSQEARAYSLLVLLSGLGFLYFLRARDGFASRDLVPLGAVLGSGDRNPLLRGAAGRGRGRVAAGRGGPAAARGAAGERRGRRRRARPVAAWRSTRPMPVTRIGSPGWAWGRG